MTANELRSKYLNFFKTKGHTEIPAAPLVLANDPTTLFTSSGMQQLVPYLKGEAHPMGTKLVDSQPSFRAQDIDEVGDNRHTTFFEMLGNWSLGDYFKKEQLTWFFQFMTEEINLDPDRLYVTVYGGGEGVIKDEESIKIWQELFKTTTPPMEGLKGFDPKVKIYEYAGKQNWWSRSGEPQKMPVGEIGGPDSEVFYDFGGQLQLHEHSIYKDQPCHPNCDCGRFIEIGNSVFMQYQKQTDGSLKPLPKKNVDFGGGLERLLMAANHKQDIFTIDLFASIIAAIEKVTKKSYERENLSAMRVIADHLKAAVFMITSGVEPSNKLQGYVLRRYLRRAAIKIRFLHGGVIPVEDFKHITDAIIAVYEGIYFEKDQAMPMIDTIIQTEIGKFTKTLEKGLKEIEKYSQNQEPNLYAFNLFQTYGFPFEISAELFKEKGIDLDKTKFDEIFKGHQQLSQTASAGLFKGGLADHSEEITKLHTATHLLHQALRQVLGAHVSQAGSNITAERLRFDFTHPEKLTNEQLKQVETLVNEQIKSDLIVTCEIKTLDEAKAEGALAFFGEKYGEKVKVYTMGNFSKEVCGGPHVEHTGVLGHFTIGKQENVGGGKRRVYGYLS